MLAEILNLRKFIIPIALVALCVIGGLTYCDLNVHFEPFFSDMLRVDNFSTSFSLLLIVIAILLIALSYDFYATQKAKISDYISIIIFTLCGALALVSFSNMTMFFIGLEVMSISFYILAGTNKREVRSNEAAMKYFLMGSFASGILLMGITLIYGASGSFNLASIAVYAGGQNPDITFYIGIILVLVALLFKVSAVPFHFWAPDVYEGSPMLITALMATLGKVASFAAFYKLFAVCFVDAGSHFTLVIAIVVALTILVGNLSAIRQDSFKRMLAFSGVTNAGFMLFAILLPKENGGSALFFYAVAYALSSIAAFAIAIAVSKHSGSEKFEAFKGLAHKHPLAALLLTFAMISIAGIPPFAGFFAKYFILSSAIKGGYFGLSVFAIINSVVAFYYYFKVIIMMFSKPENEDSFSPNFVYVIVASIAVLITIIAGFAPGLFFIH
jgi:NADH-quinone oxidoreductase subunit N